MTIKLFLLTSEPQNAEGFPLTFIINHRGKKKKFLVCRCFPEHYDPVENTITPEHPEYDLQLPRINNFKLKAATALADRPEDVNKVYDEVFANRKAHKTLKAFTDDLVKELKAQAKRFEEKKDFINANKAMGNSRVYDGAITQFDLVCPDVAIMDLDYDTLLRFKNYKLQDGNEKGTVSSYLRTLKALYNRAIATYRLPDNEPFKNIMKGLTAKKGRSTKKYMSKDMIRKIENIVHDYPSLYLYTDLWLLQFYLGGADLMDIYYLKNSQIVKGRLYFHRNKGNASENMIDLAIHPKAMAIIDKYRVEGEFVFPWRKDTEGYKTFRRKMYTKLTKAQEKHKIDMEGMGGKWGPKTARYTFANIGKLLMIHEDILRELQGHERPDVDNVYKNLYPQKKRDQALFKIID